MRFILVLLLGLLSSTMLGSAAPPHVAGRSADHDFAFTTGGDTDDWCNREVVVRLMTDKSNGFDIPFDRLQLVLGRIRGIVTSDSYCPSAELVRFRAFEDRTLVRSYWTSRLARWRIIQDDETSPSQCRGGTLDTADCAARVQALEMVQNLFIGEPWARTTITTLLDLEARDTENRPKLLEWSGDGSSGRLLRLDGTDRVFAEAAVKTIAVKVALQQASRCKGDLPDLVVDDTPAPHVSAVGYGCNGRHQEFVVWRNDDAVWVFSMALSSKARFVFSERAKSLVSSLSAR